MAKSFLEIETKYAADEIDRIAFKTFLKSLNPKNFLYVESTDIYFTKNDEFLRYRMPPETDKSKRAELTFKKKHVSSNNIVRTEVNLRVDMNDEITIQAFCEGLGYSKNFKIYKMCDIYSFEDAVIVFYTVIDELNKTSSFLEIEVNEGLELNEEESKKIILKYETALSSLGLSPQKRLKKSLFEMYRKD